MRLQGLSVQFIQGHDVSCSHDHEPLISILRRYLRNCRGHLPFRYGLPICSGISSKGLHLPSRDAHMLGLYMSTTTRRLKWKIIIPLYLLCPSDDVYITTPEELSKKSMHNVLCPRNP